MHSKDLGQNYRKLNLNRNEFTPIEIKKNGHAVVMAYLKQKDVAPWFRGTSHLHIQGADNLFNALRDDGEQNTTHRVRTCLNLIGLKPLITPKQIMFLMRLSRGNDLVFLWFLMEMHYKTPKKNPKSYSVNEQLICSAICHLDMIPTLRELDKILPKRDTLTTTVRKKRIQKRQNTEKVSNEFQLPYFSKYPRPQQCYTRLFLREPNFKVNFKFYSHNNIEQNESNRWYADYRFNPTKRIVFIIINETIKNVFYNFETAALRSKVIQVQCNYHKTAKVMANSGRKLTLSDNDKHLIHDALGKAVQKQLRDFKEQSKIQKDTMTLKTLTSDCKVFDVILGENEHVVSNSNTTPETVKLPNNLYEIKDEYNAVHSKCPEAKFDIKKANSCKIIQNERNFNYGIEKMDNKNDCSNESDVEDHSGAVFSRPTAHKPFQFNYKNIFAPKVKDNEKECIKKMFLTALNDSISGNLTNIDETSLIYDEVIKKCFDNELRKHHAENWKEFEEEKTENLKPFSQLPTITNYSAENYLWMEQMLFEAFQYLRKNPKFVWAQLPDAHRLPSLREWIALRFGKEYTPMERAKSYRMSCILFRALDKRSIKISVPNANQIDTKSSLNYNCRNHLEKKVQHMKNKYYYMLDSSFLDETRIFWFAMRGYICSNGPPRKSFFAYMPSRQQDIHHFRLWKSTEYRNYKVTGNTTRHKMSKR